MKNRWYSVILKRYSQESLDSMHINIDKLTYGTQSDVTPPSPPLPSENSGSSANVSNVTVPIQDPSEPSNLIQDLTTGDNKNDKFSCTPEASGHKRMRKRPSRYEADRLIGNGKDDQAEFAEIGLDSDEDTYESKRRRCKKAKSTVNPTLPRNQSYQTLTEDVLTSDSEWNECIDLSRQKQSSKSNHSKKYQYQYSDDRSAASFSSFFPRYPDHMNPLPPHVQSMYHRLPTSELEQVFVKMIEKTEHIIDGKYITIFFMKSFHVLFPNLFHK